MKLLFKIIIAFTLAGCAVIESSKSPEFKGDINKDELKFSFVDIYFMDGEVISKVEILENSKNEKAKVKAVKIREAFQAGADNLKLKLVS